MDRTLYDTSRSRSSSKIVKPLIEANHSDWRREVLCIGDDGQSRYIVEMESAILIGLDAKNSSEYYNQHNGDGVFSRAGRKATQTQIDGCRKGGLAKRGRKATPAQLEGARKGGLRPATPAQKAAARKSGLANKGITQPKSPCPHCGVLMSTNHMSRHIKARHK